MRKAILIMAFCFLFYGCGENYHLRRAEYFGRLGDYEKVIEQYDKALAKNPANPQSLMLKGVYTSELGGDYEAIEIYTKAIEIDPRRALIYYNRAESYMKLEEYQEALSDYNSALKILCGDESDFIRLEGGVHNDFFSVTDLDPYLIYADRAIAYYFLDSMELAWNDLNLCISRGKELGQCYYWRGVVYFSRGHEKEGCEDMLRSMHEGYEIDPFYKEYCSCLFKTMVGKGI